MSGLDSHTATAPTDELVILPSVTGSHVVPPSVVFQSPPPVAPKQYSNGRAAEPATPIDRPPRFGPMLRDWSAPKMVESDRLTVMAAPAPAGGWLANGKVRSATARQADRDRDMDIM